MKSLLWILVLLAPVCVLAQVAGSPSPLPSPILLPVPSSDPSLISTVTGLISLARGWQSLGFYVAVATALKYLIDLSKLSFIGAPFNKIPQKFQGLVVAVVGTILSCLGFMAAGVPLVTAIVAGLGSAAGSVLVHEILQDFFPGALGGSQPPSAS